MKKHLILLVACTMMAIACKKNNAVTTNSATSSNVEAGILTTSGYTNMATFNIRQDVPDPGNRAWTVRRPLVKDMINKYRFDIFGVQEAKGNQVNDMLADLGSFAKVGIGRDGNSSSEHSAIFYRTVKYSVLSSGTFWLSPGAPTSATGPSWDAAYRRICTWARFKDNATQKNFWVFNSHFDHEGATARANSASLVLSQMQAKIGSEPVIFMGDLNCDQNSAPIATLKNSSLLEETWDIASTKAPASRQTFNNWVTNPSGNSQIDHVFVSSQWSVLKRTVLWDNYNGILPSDHFPVVAEVKLPSPAAPVADGKYRIMVRHSGKAVVVSGASDSNGAAIIQWDYTSGLPDTNDEWFVTQIGTTGCYRIINVKSGKALVVRGASMAESAPCIQWDYSANDNSNDEWVILNSGVSGYYVVRNVHSSMGLNIDNNLTTNGAIVKQYPYTNTTQTNMQFQFIPVP